MVDQMVWSHFRANRFRLVVRVVRPSLFYTIAPNKVELWIYCDPVIGVMDSSQRLGGSHSQLGNDGESGIELLLQRQTYR